MSLAFFMRAVDCTTKLDSRSAVVGWLPIISRLSRVARDLNGGELMAIFSSGASAGVFARRKSVLRRAVVGIPLLGGLLTLGGFGVPFLVLGSSLRDSALKDAAGKAGWSVESASATGGWFEPVIFFDVRVSDAKGRLEGRIPELRTNCSLMEIFGGGPERRRITFVRPSIEIQLSEEGEWPSCSSEDSGKATDFLVEEASLRITSPRRRSPIVDVRSCSLAGSIEADESGASWLVVEPMQVFDHEPVSDAQCEQNLALIAPVLAQSTEVSGSASLWLDRIRIPLDGRQSSPFPIKGRAEFHSLAAKLRNGWACQLSALGGAFSGLEMPDQISMVEKSAIDFELTERGVHHKGTAFLFPEMSQEFKVVSSGTVFLDETLDLELELQLPVPSGDERPALQFLRKFSSSPIVLAVRGTVSSPVVGLPEGVDFLGEISRRVTPAQYTTEPSGVPTAISDLIQDVVKPDSDPLEKKRNLAGSILNLIRAAEKQRK